MNVFKIIMKISKLAYISLIALIVTGCVIMNTPSIKYEVRNHTVDPSEELRKLAEERKKLEEEKLAALKEIENEKIKLEKLIQEQKKQEELARTQKSYRIIPHASPAIVSPQLPMPSSVPSSPSFRIDPSASSIPESRSRPSDKSEKAYPYIKQREHNFTSSQSTKSDSFVIGEEVSKQLKNANLVLSLPSESNISKRITAELVLSPNMTLDELRVQVEQQNQLIQRSVQISKIMIAKITAPDFVISDVTSREQAISNTSPTKWIWNLEAKREGKLDIEVTLIAVVTVDGYKTEHHIRTFKEKVQIDIRADQVILDIISEHWKWAVGTLIIPFIGWAWTQYNKKSNPKT